MSEQDWLSKDFYKTLGVSKGASEQDIKKAYRKAARDLHPDTNAGDATAEAKFKSVGEAYNVLSNKDQRQRYDAIRAMGGGGPRFQAGSRGGGGFDDAFGGMFNGGQQRASGGGPGIEDILGNIFGGGGGFGRQPQKGNDLAAATELRFRDAAEGTTITLQVDGNKMKVRIPAGLRDGKKIRLTGKGRPGAHGGPAGDLVITVHVGEHPVFTMDGTNLRMSVPVTFDEAVFGADIDVPTLSGESVKMRIAPGTTSGQTLRIKGRGIEAAAGTGDLLVTVQVAVPTKLSKEATQALQTFAIETSDDNVRDTLYKEASK